MLRIKDKYSLGILAGLIANTIRTIFNSIAYYFNLTEYLAFHIAGATFLPQSKVDSLGGLLVGIFADYGVAIFFGVTIVYLLYYTGTDYRWLKGISVSLLYWLFLFGMGLRFGLSRINPTDLNTNLTFLTNHLLLGIIIVGIIKQFEAGIYN